MQSKDYSMQRICQYYCIKQTPIDTFIKYLSWAQDRNILLERYKYITWLIKISYQNSNHDDNILGNISDSIDNIFIKTYNSLPHSDEEIWKYIPEVVSYELANLISTKISKK